MHNRATGQQYEIIKSKDSNDSKDAETAKSFQFV